MSDLLNAGDHQMPRYWFNVRDGDELLLDDEKGCELANLAAVKTDAVRAARQILCAAALTGTAGSLQIQIEVVDQAGQTVLIMPVGHAIGSESQT
jgi:hypothetical protein